MSSTWNLIAEEEERQKATVSLIASENIILPAVKKALMTDLTNKYSEGYPEKRYYAGNSVIDKLENQVISLAQQFFSTDYHINVQPYSGSIANVAILNALLFPGDRFMGLALSHGGHLTHGHPVSLTGKLFKRIEYQLNPETERLDYAEIRQLAKAHRPKLIISGASSYSRQIDFQQIGEIAEEVGAYHLADISHISGLVATGLHPSPFGHADVVMTTTHKILRGPRAAVILCRKDLAKAIDRSVFPGIQGGPHMNTIAAIGVMFEEILKPDYKTYCQKVIDNATALSDELQKSGLKIISGGTDNHLLLIDLRKLNLTGKEAQQRLEKIGIITNMNAIPFDPRPPTDPSGLRLGTPLITSLGYDQEKTRDLAKKIVSALKNSKN